MSIRTSRSGIADVYKAGVLASAMWRVGEEVELGLLIHLGVDTIGAAAVGNMSDSFTAELLDMPHTMVRDVQRRATRRVRDLEG